MEADAQPAPAPRRLTKREREKEYYRKEKQRMQKAASREPKAIYMLVRRTHTRTHVHCKMRVV